MCQNFVIQAIFIIAPCDSHGWSRDMKIVGDAESDVSNVLIDATHVIQLS